MPNFPSDPGELPKYLHSLNPRHYFLLTYWVYFRPSALQSYLYQANSKLYQRGGWRKLFDSWKLPAYRHIYLMLPIASILLATLLGLTVAAYTQISVQGNTSWVNAIACSPQVCVTALGDRALKVKLPSADATLKVWDWHNGSELRTLKGHINGVTSVAIAANGQQAVSGSGDRTLKIWDLHRGTQLRTLKGHKNNITGVAVTPDGQRAISTSADGTLKVWDLQKEKELFTLTGHQALIWAVAITPDGQQAVSASADQTLKIWDLQQGKELHSLTGHHAWVTAVAITPDGKQAVSASADQTLKIWDLQQGKELHSLTGHHAWVTAVAITPDGKQAISGSFDRYPKIWSLKSGQEQSLTNARNKQLWLNLALNLLFALTVIAASVTIAISLAISAALFGAASSLISSLAIGIAGSLVFCLGTMLGDRIAVEHLLSQAYGLTNLSTILTIVFGISLGIVISTAFSLSSRKALGTIGSVLFILIIGFAVGVVVASQITKNAISLQGRVFPSLDTMIEVGGLFNLFVAIGALRLPLYPVQLVLSLNRRFWLIKHPATWDDLLILPLPGTEKLLQTTLQTSTPKGLHLLARIAENPFQRYLVQRVLRKHLHESAAPLHFLYHLLANPDLDTYILPPVSQQDWQLLPTTKQVFLGEIANTYVDCSSDWINQIAEQFVWGLTRWQRQRKPTPLTHFAQMLYELTYSVDIENLELSKYHKIYNNLDSYADGQEITKSFTALATFLAYDRLSDLSTARDVVLELIPNHTSIRPPVLTVLTRLGEIGAKVTVEPEATSQVNQLAIIAHTISHLDSLDEYVVAQVATPEKQILQRIIRQWQRLASKVAGEIWIFENADECR